MTVEVPQNKENSEAERKEVGFAIRQRRANRGSINNKENRIVKTYGDNTDH